MTLDAVGEHAAEALAAEERRTDKMMTAAFDAMESTSGEASASQSPASAPPPMNLPPGFWEERPELGAIRDAAHSAAGSADALLGAVLARVCAITSPRIMLPNPVGTPGSMNVLVGLVGASGTGKSVAMRLAAQLLPDLPGDVIVRPLGSGEGLAEAYLGPADPDETTKGKSAKKEKVQVRRGVLFTLDEGQALSETASRKGTTIMPTLRTAWAGDALGQTNATAETTRLVPAHEYRMALLAGFQPEYAAPVIADAAGGTPQRFLFLSSVDPSIPETAPPMPPPLDLKGAIIGGRTMPLERAAAAEIRARHLAKSKGAVHVDPLDAHRDLVRLKTAGLLAILAGRQNIDGDDWRLAGVILDTSDTVRSSIIDLKRRQAAEAERGKAKSAARTELVKAATMETRALSSMVGTIARHTKKHSGETGQACTRRCIDRATNGTHRQLVAFDDALAETVAQGFITEDGRGYLPGEAPPERR